MRQHHSCGLDDLEHATRRVRSYLVRWCSVRLAASFPVPSPILSAHRRALPRRICDLCANFAVTTRFRSTSVCSPRRGQLSACSGASRMLGHQPHLPCVLATKLLSTLVRVLWLPDRRHVFCRSMSSSRALRSHKKLLEAHTRPQPCN